jgi:hypothetical protein
MIEQQLESSKKTDDMIKDMQFALEERKIAFDTLEEETSNMRKRLDVYSNYGSTNDNDDQTNLFALWKKRQDAVRHAEELGLSELEMLRERLSDTETRLNNMKSPLMNELKILRNNQNKSDDILAESQQLWESERKRYVEQLNVMDERVHVMESSMEKKINVLVSETKAITNIREKVTKEESEWHKRYMSEENLLKNRKEAIENEYDIYMEQHSKDMKILQNNVLELAESFEKLKKLTDTFYNAGNEDLKKSLNKYKIQVEQLNDTLKIERLMVLQSNNNKIKTLNTDEMTSYRNKFHHLRRIATEQQAQLVAEKSELLKQIEEISTRTGQTNHAKAITSHFVDQLNLAENARMMERAASKKEIIKLRLALSKERERGERRARQHAKELANQINMSKERIHAEENLIAQKLQIEHDFNNSIEKIDSKTNST